MSETEIQHEVFAFLADPAAHGGEPVARIDTHAASVFLAGDRAIKVKRAVTFPFLDYASLAARKAACAAEFEVNRTYAPQIYRRVVPITREAGGGLAIGGTGEPVEWAVEMRRFDENATLDRLAEAGRIDAALADALARAVAIAHERAPPVEAEPWIEALRTYIAQNEDALRDFPELFPQLDIELLTKASRAAFGRVRLLLQRRGALGLIRRCHGDLHLGNIALIDGKPVLFDAIEFSPIVASGDVLYDLAFLLMDLVERRLPVPANIVLNRYLAQTRRDDDLDALAALPLFLSVRAAIRAKVTAARMADKAGAERATIAARAQDYFRLAGASIEPPAPLLVGIGGLSGTGKSALARMLAPALDPVPGAVVLRSDVMRKRLFARAETEPLPANAYSPEVTARVYDALSAQARRTIASGHSAIVDAVFAKPAERAALAALAQAAGIRFKGLFLTAGLDIRIARVGARVHDASDADADVVRAQDAYDLGTIDWVIVDASGNPEETLARAKAALSA